jgi:hypothetical protein
MFGIGWPFANTATSKIKGISQRRDFLMLVSFTEARFGFWIVSPSPKMVSTFSIRSGNPSTLVDLPQ